MLADGVDFLSFAVEQGSDPQRIGWGQIMSSRSGRRDGGDSVTDIPEFGHRLLDQNLGAVPYRLYLAEPDGSFRVLASSGLDLAPRDRWTLELSMPHPWMAIPGDGPARLSDLPRRDGLESPDPTLCLHPLREDGVLRGGLLLRSPRGRPGPALARRLRDPLWEGSVLLLLGWWSMCRRQHDLLAFRESAAATLPYGILAIDGLGRATYVGGRAASILGLSEEEAAGTDCTRIFRPVGPGAHPLLEGLRGHRDPMELYLTRPDGREIPVSLQMSPLPALGEKKKGLLAFFQDLSEERTLDEAERQRDRLAVLGELSAGVAHEIRNPLTGIANCAQVLQEGIDPDDDRQRFLRIILDEAARLNRIVEGLLHYARPNRPELSLASVEDCVHRALELTRSGAEEKGIRMISRTSGRLPKLYLDPAQITQVLLNLMRNAEEAMPAGGELTIDVAVIRRKPHRRRGTGRRASDRAHLRAGTEPLQRFVQIKVGDTGHGIPKELLSRVFNPFFTTRARGTGLGLSLSQSIVREHGGVLSVRSVANKGTTVCLDLPVERRHGERR
jgi:PAS domain S-box-containing protein